jgi:predicted PurR-regulated permease PerM
VERPFAQRVLIASALIAIAFLLCFTLWGAVDVFLAVFAALLVAVFLRGLSGIIQKWTGLGENWSLFSVILLLLAALAGVIWLLAPRITDQADQLSTQLPQAIQSLLDRLRQHEWSRQMLSQAPNLGSLLSQHQGIFARVTGALSTSLGVLTTLFVITVIGIFLAAQPRLYRTGLLRLMPFEWRPRAEQVLRSIGETMRHWLLGQLFCMSMVALLTGIGLWILGIPLGLTLALIAGLLDFIPTVGPFLAAIPGVLLAFLQAPEKALLVAVVYTGVQMIENYLLQPFAQRRAVNLPPALMLFAQLLLGVSLGLFGLVLATPLTVSAIVVVKMLYVEDVLGDKG